MLPVQVTGDTPPEKRGVGRACARARARVHVRFTSVRCIRVSCLIRHMMIMYLDVYLACILMPPEVYSGKNQTPTGPRSNGGLDTKYTSRIQAAYPLPTPPRGR